jgi:hypothetical protein
VTFWLAIAWAVCIGVAIAWALWLVRLSTSRREGIKAGEDTRVRKVGAARTRNVKPARPKPSVPAGDQVEKLKQKAAVGAPSTIASEHEVAVLKAKLGATSTAAPRKTDARNNGKQTPDVPEICHIVWSPEDGESHFSAKTNEADGAPSVVSSSPPFLWNERTPPPTSLPRAAKAHAVLVHQLKAAGWTTVGRGEEWYSLELQRRPSVAAREGEA